MEESCLIASMRVVFRSQNINHLDAELFDFQDNLLSTVPLCNDVAFLLPIHRPLRSFYFRLKNSEIQISQLYSYFWPEGQVKEGNVNLTEFFENFIIEISINIQEKKQEDFFNQQPEPQMEINPKEHLKRIKQKVFDVLQGQNFFIQENSLVKCNFIRKNKTHKNLTALLIKNSTNILKKINQNMNYSTAKTYSQLKTTQANETIDQITLQLPPLNIMKKTNSVQGFGSNFQETDSNKPRFLKKEESDCQEKVCEYRVNKSGIKKRGFFVRGKKEYEKKLQKQTTIDLKNQRQTLTIIRTYIADKVTIKNQNPKNSKVQKMTPKKRIPIY